MSITETTEVTRPAVHENQWIEHAPAVTWTAMLAAYAAERQ